jgi:hypothetical protein
MSLLLSLSYLSLASFSLLSIYFILYFTSIIPIILSSLLIAIFSFFHNNRIFLSSHLCHHHLMLSFVSNILNIILNLMHSLIYQSIEYIFDIRPIRYFTAHQSFLLSILFNLNFISIFLLA